MVLVLVHYSSLQMVFGHKICSNLWRHRVWKVTVLFEIAFVHFQDLALLEDPKHMLIIADLQIFRNGAYDHVDLKIRVRTSAIDSPFLVILLLRYTKYEISSIFVLYNVMGSPLIFITLVLALLIFRPIVLLYLQDGWFFLLAWPSVCVTAGLYHQQNLDLPAFLPWSSWFPSFVFDGLSWVSHCRMWLEGGRAYIPVLRLSSI